MKKLLCIILALCTILCLAACGGKNEPENPHDAYTEQWPDNAFFADIPAIADEISRYKESQNDRGYVYEITLDKMDYKDFCKYIAKLEKAGFGIYKATPLSTLKTEDMLPEKLADGIFNATWSGNRRGVYVAAFWYGDKYYEEHDLPQDANVRLTFFTYNAFQTATTD